MRNGDKRSRSLSQHEQADRAGVLGLIPMLLWSTFVVRIWVASASFWHAADTVDRRSIDNGFRESIGHQAVPF